MKKYDKIMHAFNTLTYDNSGLQGILTTPLDKQGEYIGKPVVEAIKVAISEMLSEYRAADITPIEKKDWWKIELERRQEEEDF